MHYGSFRMPIKRFSILVLSAVSLAFATQATALTATEKVEKEIVTTNAAGQDVTTRVPADLVTPGETIVHTVEFINDSAAPATDLVLVIPVPEEVRYIEGSADRSGANVLYSADGGETYQNRSTLEIPVVGGRTRTARSEDITHIQWTITGPVAVGAVDRITYKARLK